MAEHELNKIVDDDGEVFNLRDSTKQPVADRVTTSTGWSGTPSDTKYPSEKLVKNSLDGKVNKSGDKMTGPLQGFLLSARDTTVGNEYNVLLNAKNRGILTFTQSGSGQLTEAQVWGLFDGRIAPQYGPAIDTEDPYILELDLTSYIGSSDHCQVYSAFGWTCRYWEPLRFKVELYNTYQSANEWVTICDYSQTNYTGQYSGGGSANLFVKFGSGTVNPHTGETKGGVFRKIRITIWKGNESTNKWGISEIFFWYPEKSAVYEGLAAFSAKQLNTARKLKTNLARTADSTFDGSADQTNIPVTGTLPVGNGGTGKASVTANSYLKGNGTGALVERTYAQVRTDLGLGSVYSKDVPTSGNASTSQVVMGNDTRLADSRTPTSHASSATTYGVGTTANYGHVKLATGDMNGASDADGVAVSKNHTHSQYLTSHQDISGKMNTSASNATAPSSSGGDGATATLLNNLTYGNSDIVTTDDGDNVLIATTHNGGTETNKWYKRKLVKLIPWIIKKLGTQLVYDCGAGSTSGDDFDAALAAFNAGQWVIIRKDGIAYYCVGSYSGPGLRFKQIANDGSLLKVNTISWTRGSSPSDVTQIEASLSGHTHSQYLTASSITGKMNTNADNAASGALQNLTGQLTEGTSDFTDNTEMFTSYAGNNGFAESGHVNQPYRRKASSMLNYVRDGFAIARNPADVGTSHKRISLGYGKYNSSAVGAATYLVHLFFNYADEGGLQGKGITVLVTYDFRSSSLQKAECRILSDNGVRDAGYNVVLANYVSGSGDNSKLYICIGLVKNSAPTTLVSFSYSYCKIFKLCTIGDWTQDISSDAVGTYNYLVQATDLVSNAVNADMVDGKHIVIGSWAGASNTIYFG